LLPNLIVLIVEDHPDVRNSLERVVVLWPAVNVFSADNFLSAAVWINSLARIDLLLCDVYFPGKMVGIDIAGLAVASHPEIAVVMTSTDRQSAVEGLINRYKFVRKPFNHDDMNEQIDEAFIQINMDRANA